jgi:hypothetical protein
MLTSVKRQVYRPRIIHNQTSPAVSEGADTATDELRSGIAELEQQQRHLRYLIDPHIIGAKTKPMNQWTRSMIHLRLCDFKGTIEAMKSRFAGEDGTKHE